MKPPATKSAPKLASGIVGLIEALEMVNPEEVCNCCKYFYKKDGSDACCECRLLNKRSQELKFKPTNRRE